MRGLTLEEPGGEVTDAFEARLVRGEGFRPMWSMGCPACEGHPGRSLATNSSKSSKSSRRKTGSTAGRKPVVQGRGCGLP